MNAEKKDYRENKTAELYRRYYNKSENSYLQRNDPRRIITFNGQGNAGKTTVAKLLESDEIGLRLNLYRSRDGFQQNVYRNLQRSAEQQNIEVFGIPSITWIALEFHWKVRPFLNSGHTMIFDH